MTRDYLAAVDRAMGDCWRCQHLNTTDRDAHRRRVYSEILTTQTRQPSRLPAHIRPAWMEN